MSDRENIAENPYRSPRTNDKVETDDVTIVDGDLALLKRSLMGFGFFAFGSQILIAFFTNHLNLDIIALYCTAFASGMTRETFEKFPYSILLLLLYPVQFLGLCCLSYLPQLLDPAIWLLPQGQPFSPLGFYLVLAIWAVVNLALVARFHRLERRTGQEESSSD